MKSEVNIREIGERWRELFKKISLKSWKEIIVASSAIGGVNGGDKD